LDTQGARRQDAKVTVLRDRFGWWPSWPPLWAAASRAGSRIRFGVVGDRERGGQGVTDDAKRGGHEAVYRSQTIAEWWSHPTPRGGVGLGWGGVGWWDHH